MLYIHKHRNQFLVTFHTFHPSSFGRTAADSKDAVYRRRSCHRVGLLVLYQSAYSVLTQAQMQVRTGANTAGAYERLNLRPSPTRQATTTGLRYQRRRRFWEMEIGDDKRSDDMREMSEETADIWTGACWLLHSGLYLSE